MAGMRKFVAFSVPAPLIRAFVAAPVLMTALAFASPVPPAAHAMGARVEATPEPPGDQKPAATIPDMEEAAGHLIHLGARLTFQTAKGDFTVVTFPREAPKTVEQIVKLVKAGFYDGLAVHRVVPGMIAQMGDPQTKTLPATDKKVGRGGSGNPVPQEFTGQSVKHLPGVVALARANDPNSGDSQFYISLAAAPHLNEAYAVFGLVTRGMDVVRQLAVGDTITKAVVAQDDPATAPSPTPTPRRPINPGPGM
jgi:cyclophilin family peptidyl-prolyl cis-trans isomerase